MNEKNILKRLEKILKEDFCIPEECNENINCNTHFRNDLEMDSLDRYEFSYAVEEELKITIPDEKIMEFEEIEDYVKYIYNQ